MLNNKGFTIAEVVVSFGLISVLMVSLISATLFYRDKVKTEEVITQLLDFKNTITTVVYDDIINKKISRITTCPGVTDCVRLIDNNNEAHILKINEYNESNKRGVFLDYDGIEYMLPDSDLGVGSDRVCDFVSGLRLDGYENKLYKIKATFVHKDLDLSYDLLFVID